MCRNLTQYIVKIGEIVRYRLTVNKILIHIALGYGKIIMEYNFQTRGTEKCLIP